MNTTREIARAAADVFERLAESLNTLSGMSAPLLRLACAIRPSDDRASHTRNNRMPIIQPNAEPTELDKMRAQQALTRKGISVTKNGGKT